MLNNHHSLAEYYEKKNRSWFILDKWIESNDCLGNQLIMCLPDPSHNSGRKVFSIWSDDGLLGFRANPNSISDSKTARTCACTSGVRIKSRTTFCTLTPNIFFDYHILKIIQILFKSSFTNIWLNFFKKKSNQRTPRCGFKCPKLYELDARAISFFWFMIDVTSSDGDRSSASIRVFLREWQLFPLEPSAFKCQINAPIIYSPLPLQFPF